VNKGEGPPMPPKTEKKIKGLAKWTRVTEHNSEKEKGPETGIA